MEIRDGTGTAATVNTTSGITYVTLPQDYSEPGETITISNNNGQWIVKYNKPRRFEHDELDELFEKEL
jgi:hypothetical protein